jgi:hypothetical protein
VIASTDQCHKRRLFFLALGSAHGIYGLISALILIRIARYEFAISAVLGPYRDLATLCSILEPVGLIACGVTTWRKPRIAPVLAWSGAVAYVLAQACMVFAFGFVALKAIGVDAYVGAAIRLAAALALTLVSAERAVLRRPSPTGRC